MQSVSQSVSQTTFGIARLRILMEIRTQVWIVTPCGDVVGY